MRWDRCIFHGSFDHGSIGVSKSSWLTILNIQKPYSAFLFLGPLVELFFVAILDNHGRFTGESHTKNEFRIVKAT